MSRSGIKFYAVLCGCVLALGGALWLLGIAALADLKPQEQAVLSQALAPRAALLVVLSLLLVAGIALALRAAFQAYVEPPLKMAEDARTLLEANRDYRLSHAGGAEFRPLVLAINQLADQRNGLQQDMDQRIRDGRLSVEEERNRLAALMSELTQSVVVCNLDGRILLYNNRARLQFRAMVDSGADGAAFIGLGRSIFGVLERNLVAHALENIQHRLKREGSQPVAHFVTVTRAGQLLRVQMAPVFAPAPEAAGSVDRTITGYVLILDNITRSFETDSRRDQLLQSLTEGSRASLGNIRAAVETLTAYGDMNAEERDRFTTIIGDEVRALSRRIDQVANDYADSLKTRWPLEEMLGSDLVAAAQRRIEKRVELPCKIEMVDEDTWVKVDSFSLLQALTYLAARLKDEYAVRELRFRLAPEGRLVHLDLIWQGAVVSTDAAMSWELEAMSFGGETSPLTLRDVIERHGGEIWLQREKVSHRAFFRFLIPGALPQEIVESGSPVRGESRPEYYDFDLFSRAGEHSELDDRLLSDLTYTVFDTETTGLEPSKGDEIIQIGAVRIVNGRLLRQESFDQLVDPRRSLSRESIGIHGISEAMLVGQPSIDRVLPAFHAYCEDTVLVAHNAAFDMRFLQLKEEATGLRFNHPVVDTLLLSPLIHPNQASHRLEALAERFGVRVIGRHTALGDAIVTGEVLLKMIPLLADIGITTLGQAREAAQKSYYARISY